MIEKNKTISITIAICTVAVLFFMQFLFYNVFYNHKTVKSYENDWNITLPENINVNYNINVTHVDSSVKYTVFTCKQPPEEEFFEAGQNIDKTELENWLKEGINEIFAIDANFLPDFEKEYKHKLLQKNCDKRVGNLYIIYFPETMKLIVSQHIAEIYQPQTEEELI